MAEAIVLVPGLGSVAHILVESSIATAVQRCWAVHCGHKARHHIRLWARDAYRCPEGHGPRTRNT